MQDTPTAEAPAPAAPEPQIDSAAIESLIATKRAQQSLPMGFLAGLAAALVGAAVWAGITVASEMQIGFMAVGVGFLVGFAVRAAGRGLDPIFGIIGAVLSLLGCVAGNILAGVGFIAAANDASYFAVLSNLNPSAAIEILGAMFSAMDLLFYGIAVYEGYRFSFARITEAEIAAIAR